MRVASSLKIIDIKLIINSPKDLKDTNRKIARCEGLKKSLSLVNRRT